MRGCWVTGRLCIVSTVLNTADNVPADASLGYLSFGMPPDIPIWGNMLMAASVQLSDLALTLVIVSRHLVGDGLRDLGLPAPYPLGVPITAHHDRAICYYEDRLSMHQALKLRDLFVPLCQDQRPDPTRAPAVRHATVISFWALADISTPRPR